MIFRFRTILLCIFLPSCIVHKVNYKPLVELPEKDVEKKIITNVSVFTGRDSVLVYNKNIEIVGSKISRVFDGEVDEKNCMIIDGTGQTLLPGLVDSHVHITSTGAVPKNHVVSDVAHNLQAYLYSGVTTVYDLGGPAWYINLYKKKIRKNKLAGPSIFHTHQTVTVPRSHPIPSIPLFVPVPWSWIVPMYIYKVRDFSDAERIVKKIKKHNSSYVKLICDEIPSGSPSMSKKYLKVLIDESHKQGLKVFVHIGSKENLFDALEAGADVIAHSPYRSSISYEDALKIASYKVPVIMTLSAFLNIEKVLDGNFYPSELDSITAHPRLLDPVSGASAKYLRRYPELNEIRLVVDEKKKYYRDNIANFLKAGVPVVIGTDSSLPGIYPGSSIHQEMETLSDFGVPNYLILKGATSISATIFLENPGFGFIEPGKNADLIMVKGNPLTDIKVTRNISLIVKNGKIINRLKVD